MPEQQQNKQSPGWLASMPNDSPQKTLIVALILCLVCSIAVSSAAVLLKPLQQQNAALDRKKNILTVAGLMQEGKSIDELFQQIETRIVDLATGEYVDTIDPATFDQRKAARDPELSTTIAADRDIAGLGSRTRYARVYLVKDNGDIRKVVLPVHGPGLFSTLYGFIALEGDANTVFGLSFYEHAETPGLGGEVDNPKWRAHWQGKLAFDDTGTVQLELVKGGVNPNAAEAIHQVDALSGATLTSRGVTNLLRYWLGEDGFGPYISRINTQRG